MKTKTINTYDWDLKIFGGLNKNQIRELSQGIFHDSVFATPVDGAKNINKEKYLLRVELSNADMETLNETMGKKYANILSLNSPTHDFVFKSFERIDKREDLHGYEPSKISINSYAFVEYIYIILEYFKKKK